MPGVLQHELCQHPNALLTRAGRHTGYTSITYVARTVSCRDGAREHYSRVKGAGVLRGARGADGLEGVQGPKAHDQALSDNDSQLALGSILPETAAHSCLHSLLHQAAGSSTPGYG